MKLLSDQPAVVRADWLETAAEATGWDDSEELHDEHVRLVEERCDGGFEGLVPRRAPAPIASPVEGGSE
jgi:hypothetical protein